MGANDSPSETLPAKGAGTGEGTGSAGAGERSAESGLSGEGFMAPGGLGSEMSDLLGLSDSQPSPSDSDLREAGLDASGGGGHPARVRQELGDVFLALKRLIETLDERLDELESRFPEEEIDRLRPFRDYLVNETLERARKVMRLAKQIGAELRQIDAGREPDGIGIVTLEGLARAIDTLGDLLWVDAARIYALSEGIAARLRGEAVSQDEVLSAVEAAAEQIRGKVGEIRERRDGIRDRLTEHRYRMMLKNAAD